MQDRRIGTPMQQRVRMAEAEREQYERYCRTCDHPISNRAEHELTDGHLECVAEADEAARAEQNARWLGKDGVPSHP